MEYDNVDYMNIHVKEWSITVLEWGTPWRANNPTTFLTLISLNILYT